MSTYKLAYTRLSTRVNMVVALALLLVFPQTLAMRDGMAVAPWGMGGMGMMDSYNLYDTPDFDAATNATIESDIHQRRQL
jgi:hypothetical protein